VNGKKVIKRGDVDNIIKKFGYLRWRVIIGLPSKPKPGPASPGYQNNVSVISVFKIGGSSDVLWGNDEVDGGRVEDEGTVGEPDCSCQVNETKL
jgi:hypothetical protein